MRKKRVKKREREELLIKYIKQLTSLFIAHAGRFMLRDILTIQQLNLIRFDKHYTTYAAGHLGQALARLAQMTRLLPEQRSMAPSSAPFTS